MALVARRTPACYRDPDERERSAGSFGSRREALRAANREEQRVLAGSWHDAKRGEVTFRAFVENEWLPSKHIEATTRAAYVSNLDKHFYPFFGARSMAKISPSLVQDWVTKATADGLSPRSVKKYHTVLHSIFKRAVRDGLLVRNPCDGTELPKVIARKTRTLTAEEFERLIGAIPAQHRLMVETFIETGMRWGELIALRPRHIDFLRRTLTVEETIIEVSHKHSPTGERMVVKPYPKDNEPRTIAVRQQWLDAVSNHIPAHAISTRRSALPNHKRERRFRGTRSEPGSGSQPSRRQVSTSRSAFTISATLTRPGSSPAAPTSSPSWIGWVMRRSRPRRSTSTPCRTLTRRTLTR